MHANRLSRSRSWFRIIGGVFALTAIGGLRVLAQVSLPEVARSEMERCERRVREVRTEIVHKYAAELAKLRQGYQKAADLEGALMIREEERRVSQEQQLEGGHLKSEPRVLREIQEALVQRQGELVAQVVLETLPRLVEIKRQLTMAGRLDEAVEVRSVVGKFQKLLGPPKKASEGTAIGAEELAQAYQVDRERADNVYRGVRLVVSGRVLGVRSDAVGSAVLLMSAGTDASVVECAFSGNDYRWVQETQGGAVWVGMQALGTKAWQWRGLRGAALEVHGRGEGWGEGGPRLGSCTIAKR